MEVLLKDVFLLEVLPKKANVLDTGFLVAGIFCFGEGLGEIGSVCVRVCGIKAL